jgi:hypothetical protein
MDKTGKFKTFAAFTEIQTVVQELNLCPSDQPIGQVIYENKMAVPISEQKLDPPEDDHSRSLAFAPSVNFVDNSRSLAFAPSSTNVDDKFWKFRSNVAINKEDLLNQISK